MNDLLHYNDYFDENIPLDLINLIYDFLDIYDEMCRKMFENIINLSAKNKKITNYSINYFDNNKYFGINLDDIIIQANSDQEAILVWMKYITNHDEYDSFKYYQSEFFFMLYLYSNIIYDNDERFYIKKILKEYFKENEEEIKYKKLEEEYDLKLYNNKKLVIKYFFENNGIPEKIFNSYYFNFYNNTVLFLSKNNKICIKL